MVPHLPPSAFGFNHFANEIWYMNNAADGQYKTCSNGAGKVENKGCADSILATGVTAHKVYLGKAMTKMCG